MRAFFIFLLLPLCILKVAGSDSIMYNGNGLFLNGANVPWVDFARDIGPGETNFAQFGKLFKETHDYGANSVRFWLHTNGTATPEFDADTVKGPGAGAISDLIQILDSAYKYDVGLILSLWSHDMLRLTTGEPYLTQNRALLEDTAVLNSYINNALIPMVDSTKDHPGIIAWEIFNEPEGLIEGVPDGGWSSHGHVTREQIQFAVNRMAGAIHRVDTNLMVTNGTHTLASNSDRGVGNFYSDSALISVGGDSLGYLDFYQVHYYSFALNPFDQPCSYWHLDKPLIIGEFHPECNICGEFSNYENLINNGYAGAMGWMWTDTYGPLIKQEVQYTFLNYTAEVDIDNMLGDTPYMLLSGPEYGQVFEAGSTIDFSTEAYDTDGTVDSVTYYLFRELGEDTILAVVKGSSPYEFSWVEPDEGTYSVYAVAMDNDGYSKKSTHIAFIVGDPPVYRYEAEGAELTGGATVNDDATASGGKYVNFTSDASILWTILNCPADGAYDMIIGFGVPYGEKNNYITINGDTDNMLDIHFGGPADEWLRDTIGVDLVEGTNTIEITDFWGWMTFDFIEFPFPRPPYVKDIIITTETGEFVIDEPGGTLQMIATVVPEDAGNKEVRWTLNNPSIASIEEFGGLLTAEKNGVVRVFAWATDGSGIVVNTDVTLTNQPDALQNNYVLSTKIYPNPATDRVWISHSGNIAEILLCNIQGQVLSQYTAEKGVNSIDISMLEPGLYILTFRLDEGKAENHLFTKE